MIQVVECGRKREGIKNDNNWKEEQKKESSNPHEMNHHRYDVHAMVSICNACVSYDA